MSVDGIIAGTASGAERAGADIGAGRADGIFDSVATLFLAGIIPDMLNRGDHLCFVASSVSGERVESISKAILPFLAVEIVVIFLITYIPAISMTIPRLTGFAN